MKLLTDNQSTPSPSLAQIERLQKSVTQVEKNVATKLDELKSRQPMSRTVSLGPDTGDVKKLRQEQAEMVKKLEDFKSQITPVMNEFRTGNLMSPAMSALHEQLVAVKTESDNVRYDLLILNHKILKV